MEAMAAGKTVIATEVGGVPEIVSAKRGITVPSGEEVALAAAMLKVATQPKLRAALGAAARAFAEERFAVCRMVDGYAAVYRKYLLKELPIRPPSWDGPSPS
jgi:glycosyltransferase involved in cell wall biosynthesis